MNAPLSPLDRPASIPIVRGLLAADAIEVKEARAMEAQLRRELPWRWWLDHSLLWFGVMLVIAGIGYFFAHNWDHLTNTDKLFLSAGAVLASLVGATWAGFNRIVGKVLLLAACALVGVYIAVFGQIYQTGAHSYELFTAWAFLIFPWVALGRFVPLWLFWLALLDFAVGFYWPVSEIFWYLENEKIFRAVTISLFVLNGIALLIRIGIARKLPDWLDRGWSEIVLVTACLVPASLETIMEIFDTWNSRPDKGTAFLVGAIYAGVVLALAYYYSRSRYSLPNLAVITLNACTVLTCLTIRVIDIDHQNSTGSLIVAGFVVLAIFGSGVFFLRTQRLAHQTHA